MLRQRPVRESPNSAMKDQDNDAFVPAATAGLSAEALMEATPSQAGVVLKLHVPLIFSILPRSLKEIVVRYSCFSWLAPQWRQRHLILLGSFLYKFRNEASKTPKGSPFQVEKLEANIIPATHDDEMSPAFSCLPPDFAGGAIVTVTTFSKKSYFAVSDRDDAIAWVNSLRQARQESITRSMGHAAHVPYPKVHEYFDSLAQSLIKSKERIKAKVEEQNMRELELSGITGAGSLSRGHYG